MQVVVCLCAQLISRAPLVWHFIEYQRQDVFFLLFWLHGKESIYEAFSRCILPVFLEVKSPTTHIPSAFFFFNSTFPFAILSCFNPAGTFHFAFRHVCSHSRPPNNPTNARAPSFGSRLSLFPEVSY